jgi:hypothetical protein
MTSEPWNGLRDVFVAAALSDLHKKLEPYYSAIGRSQTLDPPAPMLSAQYSRS